MPSGLNDGGGPCDVVGLPFAGLAVGVGERDGLLVKTAGLAIDVGFVVVVIEHLQFVAGVAGAGGGEKDSAVAAELAGAGYVLGNFPFDVKLVVLESALSLDVAGGLVDGEDAVGDGPVGGSGAILGGDPFVEILAVEEDDCVGGRGAAGCAGRDDLGLGLPDFGVFGLRRGLGLGLLGECDGSESYEQEQGSG